MESNPATRSRVFGIRSIEDATATNLEPISLDLEMNNLAGCENGWLSRKRPGAMSQKLQIGKRRFARVSRKEDRKMALEDFRSTIRSGPSSSDREL
jgi:hypothetical protein